MQTCYISIVGIYQGLLVHLFIHLHLGPLKAQAWESTELQELGSLNLQTLSLHTEGNCHQSELCRLVIF